MFDCHCHSNHSLDGRQTLDEIVPAAKARGLSGIAITDHVNGTRFQSEDTHRRFLELYEDILRHRDPSLKLFFGVEMGDVWAAPEDCRALTEAMEFDVVLGSVHRPSTREVSFRYLDLDPPVSDEVIHGHFRSYLGEVLRTVQTLDMDVLAHITLPLRYLNRDHHRGIRWEVCETEITEILRTMAERNLALEINTAGWEDEAGYHTVPEVGVLKRFRELGGRRITLAADSHSARRVADHFPEAIAVAKEAGFDGAYYFEKRQGIFYPFL